MQGTIVWASLDPGKDYIKIWSMEPEYVEPNNVFVGKGKCAYLGCSCVANWPGPPMTPGDKKKVMAMFIEVTE